jgi:hypothetical protein
MSARRTRWVAVLGALAASCAYSEVTMQVAQSGANSTQPVGGNSSQGGANGTLATAGTTAVGGSSSIQGGADTTGVGGVGLGGTQSESGGVSSVGQTATGGATAGSNAGGGASSSGGVGTGGRSTTGTTSTSSGGNASSGGTTSGNTRTSGGATSTGGTPSTNSGTARTGGAPSSGGTASIGGASSTGGKTATGGSLATSSTGGTSGAAGASSTCTPSATKFSFFVTSQAGLFALAQAFNGSTKGFGGDLRYGQSTGLAGADKICTALAESSMSGNCKTWRAFLSVSDNGSGTQVNAISRIGSGPWYDRVARLFGTNTTTIAATRPDGDAAIINDLPNEFGVLNHDALKTGNTTNQDNHNIMTGSTTTGTLYGANAHCINWTSSLADTTKKPRMGHSWPRATSAGSWISFLDESGCAPGVNIVESGGPGTDGTVGSGGGYGGFYCFALTP